MNIINKLTLRHLKENKKRTVVTIIGIIISVAMITATCVSVTSLIHVFAQSEAYTGGNWHIELENADAGQIEKLEQNAGTRQPSRCSRGFGQKSFCQRRRYFGGQPRLFQRDVYRKLPRQTAGK